MSIQVSYNYELKFMLTVLQQQY